jgi:hypothetical protein
MPLEGGRVFQAAKRCSHDPWHHSDVCLEAIEKIMKIVNHDCVLELFAVQ